MFAERLMMVVSKLLVNYLVGCRVGQPHQDTHATYQQKAIGKE